MKNKKLLIFLLALVLGVSCIGGLVACGKKDDLSKSVAFITAAAGQNDNGYNQSGVEGLKLANAEYGVKYKVVDKPNDVASAIEECAEQGYGLIFSLEYDFTSLISGSAGKKPLAERYPNSSFVVFNDTPNVTNDTRKFSNVICVTFDVHEASFIAGTLAVQLIENQSILKSENYALTAVPSGRKVGFIGGSNSNGITVFGNGFYQGIDYVAKTFAANYTVYDNLNIGFADSAQGQSVSKTMYDNGVNVVYACAGNVGTGITKASKDAKKLSIEVDANRDMDQPGYVMTSVLKNTQVPVFEIIKAFQADTFSDITDEKGVISYDMASGATGITDLEGISKGIKNDETSQIKWMSIKKFLDETAKKFGKEIKVLNAQAGEDFVWANFANIAKAS